MIELSSEQYRLIRRTDRRMLRAVWIILFLFAVLFGGLLLFSMFGCTPSQDKNIITKGENTLTLATNSELLLQNWNPPKYTLVFTADGQIEINGKPVEKMNDPEIKIAVKEIAKALKKQTENDELVEYYDKQIGYLLEELEKCRGGKP